ncbi:MAG: hypothetical protein EBT09_00910 [Actinobacteria bacterium]|nr:hypothetical protein [Actinomycetota bacterium]
MTYVDGDMDPQDALRAATRLVAKAGSAGYVPETIRANARRGIGWYLAGRGAPGLDYETVRVAREIAAGRISGALAITMAEWFPAHMSDLDAPAAHPGHPRYPSPVVVAHALRGGGTRAQSLETLRWARNHQPFIAKAVPADVANLDWASATRLARMLVAKADVSREPRDPSGRWSAGGSAAGDPSGSGAQRGDLERRRAIVQAEHDRMIGERDQLRDHIQSLDHEHQRAMGRDLPPMGWEHAGMGDQDAARAIREDRQRYVDVLREHDSGIAGSRAELRRLDAALTRPEPPDPDFLPSGRFALGDAVQRPVQSPRSGSPGTPGASGTRGGPARRDVASQLRDFDRRQGGS